jgi:hypothetical protein
LAGAGTAANHRDDGLIAATLDAIITAVPLPERPTLHLDAGYDYQPCRQVLATRGMTAISPPAGDQRRSRRIVGG